MKLDLRSMLAGECDLLPVHFTLQPSVSSEDRNDRLWGVRFPSPMSVNGEIINTAGYMRMSLDLSLDYVAPCARCLCDVNGSFTFHLDKTVATRGQLSGTDEEKWDDYAIVEDGFLDMDEELLELLEMEFPMRILCREDCKGLCPRCGKDLNEGPCQCPTHDPDPRLAPLGELLNALREKEQNDNQK